MLTLPLIVEGARRLHKHTAPPELRLPEEDPWSLGEKGDPTLLLPAVETYSRVVVLPSLRATWQGVLPAPTPLSTRMLLYRAHWTHHVLDDLEEALLVSPAGLWAPPSEEVLASPVPSPEALGREYWSLLEGQRTLGEVSTMHQALESAAEELAQQHGGVWEQQVLSSPMEGGAGRVFRGA